MNTTEYTRTAVTTRKVTNEIRDMAHYLNGRVRFHGNHIGDMRGGYFNAVNRRGAHGGHWLHYESTLRAGINVMFNAAEGELWVRPAERADGSVQIFDKTWRELCAETRYLDVLFEVAEELELTLHPHGETLEGLTAWRESRRGQI